MLLLVNSDFFEIVGELDWQFDGVLVNDNFLGLFYRQSVLLTSIVALGGSLRSMVTFLPYEDSLQSRSSASILDHADALVLRSTLLVSLM